MRHRLFNLAAAVSLVLCLATMALWVRTRTLGSDSLGRMTGHRAYEAYSVAGKLYLSYFTYDRARPAGPWTWTRVRGVVNFEPAPPLRWSLLGFSYRPFRRPGSGAQYLLVLPYPPLSILWAIAPVWWSIGAWRRQRRRVSGCCPTCGYDLRATPDRCPECGSTVRTRTRAGIGAT